MRGKFLSRFSENHNPDSHIIERDPVLLFGGSISNLRYAQDNTNARNNCCFALLVNAL